MVMQKRPYSRIVMTMDKNEGIEFLLGVSKMELYGEDI